MYDMLLPGISSSMERHMPDRGPKLDHARSWKQQVFDLSDQLHRPLHREEHHVLSKIKCCLWCSSMLIESDKSF